MGISLTFEFLPRSLVEPIHFSKFSNEFLLVKSNTIAKPCAFLSHSYKMKCIKLTCNGMKVDYYIFQNQMCQTMHKQFRLFQITTYDL
jgi:hypothetical protein